MNSSCRSLWNSSRSRTRVFRKGLWQSQDSIQQVLCPEKGYFERREGLTEAENLVSNFFAFAADALERVGEFSAKIEGNHSPRPPPLVATKEEAFHAGSAGKEYERFQGLHLALLLDLKTDYFTEARPFCCLSAFVSKGSIPVVEEKNDADLPKQTPLHAQGANLQQRRCH